MPLHCTAPPRSGGDAPAQKSGIRYAQGAAASQVAFGGQTASSQGSNAFASGANQNSGNFISDRPTTRLHAPPGGGSAFGGGGATAAMLGGG